MILVVGYFIFLYRHFAGTVSPDGDPESYS